MSENVSSGTATIDAAGLPSGDPPVGNGVVINGQVYSNGPATWNLGKNYLYEGTVTVNPTWTVNTTPINWTPNNNPVNWTPNYNNPYVNDYPFANPNYINIVPQPKPKITFLCPHCSQETELTTGLHCTKCFQALITPSPYPTTYPFMSPVVNPAYPTISPGYIPAVPAKQAMPPAPAKEKEPEAHPGDGSRWDDI